jgi:soluble lytic murein transglycosylase-like protein
MTKYTTAICGALALACGLLGSPVKAQEHPGAFFASDFNRASAAPRQARGPRAVRRASPGRAGVSDASGIFARSAQRHGVPVRVALATIRHESGGRCNARGSAGELGPLQIKPATARGLGYRGPAGALATCGAGLEWGMRHLALAYAKCGHVGPHNYGLGGGCRRTAYVNAVMRRS